jgi:hypothetical protein
VDIPPDRDVEWEITSGFALVEGINDHARLFGWAEAQRLKDIAALYDQPTPERPTTEKPTTGRPAAERPTAERPVWET